jgi:hypothetical protein
MYVFTKNEHKLYYTYSVVIFSVHVDMETEPNPDWCYFLGHVNKVLVTTCLGSRGLGELFNFYVSLVFAFYLLKGLPQKIDL